MSETPHGRSPAQRAVRLIDFAGTDQAANAAAVDWRSYETPLPQVLAILCAHRAGAFYDVGANTGFYSVLIGRHRLARQVRCFEPVPAIADMCRSNLSANRLEIEVTETAVGDSVGTVQLYLPPADHGLVETSASLLPDFKETIDKSLTVPIVTLDAFNEGVGAENVGVIKIDVEGAEDAVLRGASAVTEQFRPLITVELLPRSNWGEVDAFMARHSYKLIPLSSSLQFVVRSQAFFVPDAHNQLLVPDEYVDEVLGLLHGVEQDRTVEEALRQEDPGRSLAIEAEVDRLSYSAWRTRCEQNARTTPGSSGEVLAALETSREAAQRAEQKLEEVYNSNSWRVTRPLRVLGSFRKK